MTAEFDNTFRRPFTVERTAAGQRVAGRWVDGRVTELPILASKQPLKGEELQSLPEGRRTMASYKLFTDTKLNGLQTTSNPDHVIIDGERFEVMRCMTWQNGIINHYEVIVLKEKESDAS